MKTGETIRSIMRSRGFTQTALAERLGIRQPAVAKMLTGGNSPQINTLNNYLEVLGYRVALVPVGANLPEGCYVIDTESEGE